MKNYQVKNSQRGFTFIELLIGVALALIVFTGIYGGYRLTLKVIGQSKARVTALALASQRIEEVRNLSYGDVGLDGGYPAGDILDQETIYRNGIEYLVETDIKYGINCLDGVGIAGLTCPAGADDECPVGGCPEDSCPNDYKKVKIKVSWQTRFSGEVYMEDIVAPKTAEQECQETGGFLLASVFDASGASIVFPQIDVENLTTSQTWQATPDSGKYTFVLPEEIDGYRIEVSKPGYSQARTFAIGETYQGEVVAIPDNPDASVFESDFTEKSFSIDELSTFEIYTLSPLGADSFFDTFSDELKISEKSQLEVLGGEVNIAELPGIYFEGGSAEDDICSFPGTLGDCGQSFTTGSSGKQISEASLFLKKEATTTPSDIYLEIRSGGTTGSVLGTSNSVNQSLLTNDLAWLTFTFGSPVDLSTSTQYFLRLRSTPTSCDPSAGAQGQIRWGFSDLNSYSGGESFRYIGKDNNPSDSGEALIGNDFSFRIFGDEYYSSGYLMSEAVTPSNLVSWGEFSWADYEPISTQINYQVYYYNATTGWEIIPDSDLTGNSAGFGSSPVDLSGLDIADYYSLKFKASFASADSSKTPTLYDWQASWSTSVSIPISNVSFDLRGEKTVGKNIGDEKIYKYSTSSLATDASGELVLTGMEWDFYHFSNFSGPSGGLDLNRSDPDQPVNLLPGATTTVELFLSAENSLLVDVNDSDSGNPIFSAQVRLYNVGLSVDITQFTNLAGQTIFVPLEIATYNLEISADGYQDYSGTVSVFGDDTKTVNLISS